MPIVHVVQSVGKIVPGWLLYNALLLTCLELVAIAIVSPACLLVPADEFEAETGAQHGEHQRHPAHSLSLPIHRQHLLS